MIDWISVKDRLPEVCRHVLTYDGDDIREGFLTKQGHWMRRYNGASFAITHWLPLPPPPKEELPHNFE
jgi:hypothetical protein